MTRVWRMFWGLGISVVMVASTGGAAQTMPAAGRNVHAAMGKAATYLLGADAKGMDDLHQAMVLTALLNAAPSLDTPQMLTSTPAMAERISRVTAMEPTTLQAAAWQLQAMSLLPDRPDTHAAMERAAGVLIKALKEDRELTPPKAGASALSADDLQLAVAALQLVTDEGVEVPAELWKQLEKTCTPPEGAKKVGTLRVVNDMDLREAAAVAVTQLRVFDALYAEGRKPGEEDKAIAPTLARLAKLYKPMPAAGDAAYALTDLMLFTGQRRLAGTLWLPVVDREVLAAMGEEGVVHVSAGGKENVQQTIEATARALLLLAKANAPVAICKFSYDGEWNGRPRDVANITAWLSDALGRPLRWEVVSTNDDAAAWNMASVLFMTGSADPQFAPATLARLRDFASEGGLILSSPDNRATEFSKAIVSHWAPAAFDGAFKVNELAEDHPLFTLWGKLNSPPKLESISNGVRELWVHSRSDLGATWHGRRLNTHDQWTFAANLFLYTTGRENMRSPVTVREAPEEKPAATVRMAAVKYGGNWNPEPELSGEMTEQAKRYKIDLIMLETEAAELDAKQTPVAHLTGAGALTLSDEQVAGLRKYMESGGLLIVDAAGGSEAFTKSFSPLVEKLTPGMKLQTLPLNHPIYNGAIPGSVKMTAAHYRKQTLAAEGRLTAPRLQACVDEFGRPRLIFSSDDITCGILDITTWGVFGYDSPSAKALMRNMILYSASDGRTPATLPGKKNEGARTGG